ncbi:hypothetical protein MUP79_03205 [Candidatus Bathyarchaeota archaeon]|nr:hypothetical protein [Candidatus Bathyarchaeota archaeon]
MKTSDIRKLKEIVLPSDKEYQIPENWVLIKPPTKVEDSTGQVFKIVIGSA